jgi:hypothetical protein
MTDERELKKLEFIWDYSHAASWKAGYNGLVLAVKDRFGLSCCSSALSGEPKAV